VRFEFGASNPSSKPIIHHPSSILLGVLVGAASLWPHQSSPHLALISKEWKPNLALGMVG